MIRSVLFYSLTKVLRRTDTILLDHASKISAAILELSSRHFLQSCNVPLLSNETVKVCFTICAILYVALSRLSRDFSFS